MKWNMLCITAIFSIAIFAGCSSDNTENNDIEIIESTANILEVSTEHTEEEIVTVTTTNQMTNITPLEITQSSEAAATDDMDNCTDPIVINVGVDKEFTSFTAAMQAAAQVTEQKVIVNVFAGEYDIYSELGGVDYIAGIGDKGCTEIQPVLNGDVEIKGIGNVILKLEIPSDIYSQYPNQCNRVSAINNSKSISVENITFKCQNCRYAIHDECGNDVNAANTKHIFRNCRFYHTNTLHVIGIGTVTGYFEIENCYAKNTNGCLFLHDWSNSTGGNLIVSNCIFDSEINNEILLSVNSNHNAVFDVYLSNNNFEKLAVNSVNIDTCNTNIFRIIGVNNTISSVEIVDGLKNPYPVKLV